MNGAARIRMHQSQPTIVTKNGTVLLYDLIVLIYWQMGTK